MSLAGNVGSKAWDSCKSILVNSRFILFLGLLCCAALIIEGIVCFLTCSFDIRVLILNFYYIFFGGITICCEIEWRMVLDYFVFIESYSGKGMWYIFLGSIALGGEWWSLLIALALVCNGILNLVGGCNLPPRTKNLRLKAERKTHQNETDGVISQQFANNHHGSSLSYQQQLQNQVAKKAVKSAVVSMIPEQPSTVASENQLRKNERKENYIAEEEEVEGPGRGRGNRKGKRKKGFKFGKIRSHSEGESSAMESEAELGAVIYGTDNPELFGNESGFEAYDNDPNFVAIYPSEGGNISEQKHSDRTGLL